MKTANEFFAYLNLLGCPVLNLKQGVPIIANFTNIPLTTMEIGFLLGNDLFGFFECESITFYASGIMVSVW